MQKLVRILDHNPHDADELNEYLSTGWEVVNFITFPHGTHFLIQEIKNPVNNLLTLGSLPPGLYYKGTLELDHPIITEGSTVITKENTVYTITKTF